jgi:hypothetical protein
LAKKLGKIHHQILGVFEKNRDGISIHQIRAQLPADIGPQQHLDKRVRELYYQHDIVQEGGKYFYRGPRAVPLDNQGITSKLRAAVLNKAHGRCQMCGRTVAEDGIKLQADHKIPHNWGGPTDLENLWAICGLCNSGKRDFFASFDDAEMEKLVKLESVHARLAEVLRIRGDSGAPSWFLDFVANVNDFQEDWQRRLRELRSLGLEYKFAKAKLPSGKVETTYKLEKWKDLPPDPAAEVKRVEKARRSPS